MTLYGKSFFAVALETISIDVRLELRGCCVSLCFELEKLFVLLAPFCECMYDVSGKLKARFLSGVAAEFDKQLHEKFSARLANVDLARKTVLLCFYCDFSVRTFPALIQWLTFHVTRLLAHRRAKSGSAWSKENLLRPLVTHNESPRTPCSAYVATLVTS